MFFMRRQLTIYKTGNLKQVGWNHQYIEVFQIKFQRRWLERKLSSPWNATGERYRVCNKIVMKYIEKHLKIRYNLNEIHI